MISLTRCFQQYASRAGHKETHPVRDEIIDLVCAGVSGFLFG
jgi:hypothetical protein